MIQKPFDDYIEWIAGEAWLIYTLNGKKHYIKAQKIKAKDYD